MINILFLNIWIAITVLRLEESLLSLSRDYQKLEKKTIEAVERNEECVTILIENHK